MAEETTNTEDIRNTVVDLERRRVLEIDDEDYTIDDHDDYDLFVFTSLSADRTLAYPTLSKHYGKRFGVINADGSFDVNCTPAGTDKINNYNAIVPITEKGGRWDFRGATGQWLGNTDGRASILEVSTESSDSLTTTRSTWDNVSFGAAITIPTAGTWLIDAYVDHFANVTTIATYIYLSFGVSTASGNNVPNLIAQYRQGKYFSADYLGQIYHAHILAGEPIEITSDSTPIYVKCMYESDETAATHYVYGQTNYPMYIRARRIK